jgi:hypothetical protein
MIGQGGGQEPVMDRIVVGVGMMGQGGGHRFAVVPVGVCAVVIFIAIFVRIFDWPRRRAQSRGGIGCDAGVDVVCGFVCAIVMVSDVGCGGMWWRSRCYIILFRLKWWPRL